TSAITPWRMPGFSATAISTVYSLILTSISPSTAKKRSKAVSWAMRMRKPADRSSASRDTALLSPPGKASSARSPAISALHLRHVQPRRTLLDECTHALDRLGGGLGQRRDHALEEQPFVVAAVVDSLQGVYCDVVRQRCVAGDLAGKFHCP